MPSELMINRCAQIFAAFEGAQYIHRGHLVAWAMYRPYETRDAYITAFKSLFGAGKSTLRWRVVNTPTGLSAEPDLGPYKGHIVLHERIEMARAQLNGDALPVTPMMDFTEPPRNAKGLVGEVVAAAKRSLLPDGRWIFYGQSLDPGRLLKVGKIIRGQLGTELGWWLSAHSWVTRTRGAKSELLWAVSVESKTIAGDLERTFQLAFSELSYSFKPSVPYGREWFYLSADGFAAASALRGISESLLLGTKERGRAGEFYE